MKRLLYKGEWHAVANVDSNGIWLISLERVNPLPFLSDLKENNLHYKNGREANNGDKVVAFPSWGAPVIGILYDATPGNDFCNGKLAPIAPNDPVANLAECLHWDDVVAAVNS